MRLVRRAQMVSGRRQASRSGRLRLALRHVGGRTQQLQVATAILQGLPDLPNGQTVQLGSQPARTSTMGTHRFNVPQRASRMAAFTPQRPSQPRSRGFQLMLLVLASVLLGIVMSGRVIDLMRGTHHKPLYIHGQSITSKALKNLHRAGK